MEQVCYAIHVYTEVWPCGKYLYNPLAHNSAWTAVPSSWAPDITFDKMTHLGCDAFHLLSVHWDSGFCWVMHKGGTARKSTPLKQPLINRRWEAVHKDFFFAPIPGGWFQGTFCITQVGLYRAPTCCQPSSYNVSLSWLPSFPPCFTLSNPPCLFCFIGFGCSC